jgi:hypothetical protein
MNKKIKLIAKQAEIDYDLRPEIARTPLWIGTDEELEKFAELIIQECIDYCGENLSKTVGGALKIHFGVKE